MKRFLIMRFVKGIEGYRFRTVEASNVGVALRRASEPPYGWPDPKKGEVITYRVERAD